MRADDRAGVSAHGMTGNIKCHNGHTVDDNVGPTMGLGAANTRPTHCFKHS